MIGWLLHALERLVSSQQLGADYPAFLSNDEIDRQIDGFELRERDE